MPGDRETHARRGDAAEVRLDSDHAPAVDGEARNLAALHDVNAQRARLDEVRGRVKDLLQIVEQPVMGAPAAAPEAPEAPPAPPEEP